MHEKIHFGLTGSGSYLLATDAWLIRVSDGRRVAIGSVALASNGPSGGQIMLIVIMLALYGPSGGIVIFDTQDSNRKSHEIGESAISPSQSIICNCTDVRVLVP